MLKIPHTEESQCQILVLKCPSAGMPAAPKSAHAEILGAEMVGSHVINAIIVKTWSKLPDITTF